MAFDQIFDWSLRARGFKAHVSNFAGVDIRHIQRAGRRNVGPALVFVHGVGSSSAHFHDTLLRLVPEGRPLYALDLPGHGQSAEFEGPATPDALEDVLDAYLTRVVGGPFVLIGNSLGGALVVRHAWTRPERVVGVLASSPALGFRSRDDWIELKSRLVLDTAADAERFVRSVFVRPPPGISLLAREFLRSMNRPSVRRLLSAVEVEDFALPLLGPPRPPTLIVWGRSERVFSPPMLEGLRRLMPSDVEIEEPEDIGHCPHLDSPGWFAARVSAFVDALEARPRLRAAHIG